MTLRRIKCKNFKILENNEYFLEPYTYIKGPNGIGKSTLALETILYCFWNYTPKQTIKDLPTRGKSTTCEVEIEAVQKRHKYIIKRQIPNKLIIIQDNIELKFNTNTEAQKFIDETFCTREYFQKFRIIDRGVGSNFLEEGQLALKKVLFSHIDEYFNNIRAKLICIKRNREIYNKDAVISKHYPSDNRLETLEIGLQELESKLNSITKELKPLEEEYRNCSATEGKLRNELSFCSKQQYQVQTNKQCYACKRGLSEEKQKEMLNKIETKVENLEISKQDNDNNIHKKTEILAQKRKQKDNIYTKLRKIEKWINILSARLKQKDYKYTASDIEIVKKTIKELDRISSEYIVDNIKSLEPVINSVLDKIGFILEITIKGTKLALVLEREGIKYSYKDLSTGQRLILQIAFKLALLLQKGETGIIIADEGFNNLDDENLNHVLDIFKSLSFQLIFILHKDVKLEGIKIIDLNEKEK